MAVLARRLSVHELQQRCVATRIEVLDEAEVAGSGHLGPAFSVIEVLVALYYGFLNIRPTEPGWPDRDRFILGKGHACSAVYPILADLGYFGRDQLTEYTRLGSMLGDHPDMRKVPGFDFSSGSLGHGLSVGAGMAEGLRLRGAGSKVVVLMGDGELNEGQVWEAAAYAAHRKLAAVLGIVDVNKVSVDGATADILQFEPLTDKWRAFGWRVERIDGHDLGALLTSLDAFRAYSDGGGDKPTVLLADTVAGRGVSFIEGMAEWHVGFLGPVDRERAVRDIEAMFTATAEVKA